MASSIAPVCLPETLPPHTTFSRQGLKAHAALKSTATRGLRVITGQTARRALVCAAPRAAGDGAKAETKWPRRIFSPLLPSDARAKSELERGGGGERERGSTGGAQRMGNSSERLTSRRSLRGLRRPSGLKRGPEGRQKVSKNEKKPHSGLKNDALL
ncbi:unnamed protein product [Lampetra fluviatilis]